MSEASSLPDFLFATSETSKANEMPELWTSGSAPAYETGKTILEALSPETAKRILQDAADSASQGIDPKLRKRFEHDVKTLALSLDRPQDTQRDVKTRRLIFEAILSEANGTLHPILETLETDEGSQKSENAKKAIATLRTLSKACHDASALLSLVETEAAEFKNQTDSYKYRDEWISRENEELKHRLSAAERAGILSHLGRTCSISLHSTAAGLSSVAGGVTNAVRSLRDAASGFGSAVSGVTGWHYPKGGIPEKSEGGQQTVLTQGGQDIGTEVSGGTSFNPHGSANASESPGWLSSTKDLLGAGSSVSKGVSTLRVA